MDSNWFNKTGYRVGSSRSRGLNSCPWIAGALLATAGVALAANTPHPTTPVRPIVDDYYGTRVTDSYRWMEQRNSDEFQRWLKVQDDYARSVLAAIPGRDALRRRIHALSAGGIEFGGVWITSRGIVYSKRSPEDAQSKIYARYPRSGEERLLFAVGVKGQGEDEQGTLDYYSVSPDGRYVAVGVSSGGTHASVIRIIDALSGKTLPERMDRAQAGSPAWLDDGRSFFYHRMALVSADAPEAEKWRNSVVYLHKIGTPSSADRVVVGPGISAEVEVDPIDFPVVYVQTGSKYAVAQIYHGAGPCRFYVALVDGVVNGKAHWRRVADVDDYVFSLGFHGDDLYALSSKDASRDRVLRTSASKPDLKHAQVVVPESDRAIQSVVVAADGLYLSELDAGVVRLRRYSFSTRRTADVSLPIDGSVGELAWHAMVPGVLLSITSWVSAPRWFQYDPSTSAMTAVALSPPWSVDTSQYMAEEVRVLSHDGVQVPLSIIRKREFSADHTHPLWLYSYGAYGASLTPGFTPVWLAILERDGVVAVAHIRGGGELGEAWHQAGKASTKTNSHRDLIACAEYLIRHGYTSPSQLAIQGMSAGGVATGMALTERPDLFRVALIDVGDENALRAEFETNGEANAIEYGSIKSKDGFQALFDVDAVLHVKDHTPYPAVLLTTGNNDPMVAPWQPGKMAARLQAASSSGRPVLLRVDFNAGHGSGPDRDQQDDLFTDQLSFFLSQVGGD